jgi:methyl-accepting chemotaxis protein
MTLKTKLALGFGVVVLVFALAGTVSTLKLREQRISLHEITENDLPMFEELQKCVVLVQLYRKAEKDVLLTVGEAKAQAGYLAKLTEISTQTTESLAKLDKATQANEDLSAEIRKIPGTVRESFRDYDTFTLGLARELGQPGNTLTAQEANERLTGRKDSIHRAEKGLERLGEATMKMLISNMDEMAEVASKTELILIGSMILGVCMGVAMAVLVLLSVTRPLGRVMTFAEAVSAGNLEARATGTFTAEMARLHQVITTMVTALKEKIAQADSTAAAATQSAELAKAATREATEAKARAEQAKAEGMMEAAGQLEKAVEIISSASVELSAQVEQANRGAGVQAQRAAQTATAMEEMNATVLEVARNASEASESSHQARGNATKGAQVVSRVVEGMGAIQSVSEAMRQDMADLGRQAEGIGRIMGVISDIADQTNLLALNAAIEAARAGDAGRGFAVVADEVRKLAEKTMIATKEVAESVGGIQLGTQKNLANVERAAQTIEEATALANQSGESLREIVTLVEIASDQVSAIATASQEQSAASEEINRSVEDIHRVSDETAASMAQSAQAVEDLAAQTSELRGLIERMKKGG